MYSQLSNASPLPDVINELIYDYARPSYLPQLNKIINTHLIDYRKLHGGAYIRADFLELFFMSSYLYEQKETTATHKTRYHANYCRMYGFTRSARELNKVAERQQINNMKMNYINEQPALRDSKDRKKRIFNMRRSRIE